ncbi:MAG: formylglycine-generating enzyme family protein [Treponema sp.]|nr:formylglycine-generating enzyme family protein [Treponema sp.]
MKRVVLCLFLVVLSAAVFAQNVTITGTFSYNDSKNYTFVFSGNRFNGTWGGDRISGTFTISGNRMTIRVTEWDDTWTWTIRSENHLVDQDGDDWYKEQVATLNPELGFVRINGGTFTMGSPANEAGRESDEIQRQVTISAFQMSRYPVTQGEYQEIMGTNPSHFRGDNLPVEQVSWFDAIDYCNRRSQREGLTPAYTISGSGNNRTVTWNRNANGYRLPTEAEWEYACRAGTTTAYNTGANITTSQANFDSERTTPVDRYPANRWGLYDMHGNVLEWCWDWYGAYASGAQTNPTGAVSGDNRVIRGGSWHISVGLTRSASRVHSYPSLRYDFVGFRLLRP